MSSTNDNKISPYNKTKISIISSVLVIMVIYVHGNFYGVEQFRFANFVNCIVSRFSYRVINPSYFAISGFLFFYRINKATDCFLKMKKRISTVAVPFVLWNVFYILEKILFLTFQSSEEFFKRIILPNSRHFTMD